jgi:phospholipid transport system substrate-binding protein
MNPSRALTHGTALLILALALGLITSPRSAAVDRPAPLGPMGLVQSSVARVLEIVQSSPTGSDERRTGIVRVSHELFDFREIARRALGQHWKGLSPAEQDEFVLLFTDVLERAFIASVEGYSDEKVTFTGEAIDGGWAQVHSRIIPHKGAPVSVDYRLHEVNLRWAVYDVVSERMSLVASYRSQFNSVLRAATFAELLQRMRADGLRRRERSTQTPVVPEAWEAGLFAQPHAADASTSASPALHGSSPQTEVSP